MDAELLAAQISTLNEAIVRLDGRIDAMLASQTEDNQDASAYDARLAALEQEHAQCQAQLQTLISATERIAEAEAREAEADADAAEAEAEIAQEIAADLAQAEPVTEEEVSSEEVTELEPEPPNESGGSDGQRQNSSNWLEKFLVLR